GRWETCRGWFSPASRARGSPFLMRRRRKSPSAPECSGARRRLREIPGPRDGHRPVRHASLCRQAL
ncbi:MAG: hypothetical protein AVDCRST_MAG55-2831, partial [uncultured Rubrobacteraceae bacterium]